MLKMIPRGSNRLLQTATARPTGRAIRFNATRHFSSITSSHLQHKSQTRPTKSTFTDSRPYQHPQIRGHSTPATKSRVYNFDEIKSVSEQPEPDRILIDVREPSEYQEGYIPTAINLPIKSAPEALLLPADDFEDRFGLPKPAVDQEVIFYCRSGVRSSAAAQLAEQAGYQKIGEYRGSYLDWAEKGGPVGR